MWKNIAEPVSPQMTTYVIWRTRTACCIVKATNTHSEYVIIIAVQLQQWLHERASLPVLFSVFIVTICNLLGVVINYFCFYN